MKPGIAVRQTFPKCVPGNISSMGVPCLKSLGNSAD